MTSSLPARQTLPSKYKKYVTAQLVKNQPIYNWFVYPHSFAKELVVDLVNRFSVSKGGEGVLDIFVGAGTTPLACKELDINSWGYDILPLSVMITNTKIADYNLNNLKRTWSSIEGTDSIPPPEIDIPLINRAFSVEVRRRLHGILEEIYEKVTDEQSRNFFHLALLHILEDVSCTKKSGGWLSIVEGKTDGILADEVSTRFRCKVENMFDDLEGLGRNRSIGNRYWGASIRDARQSAPNKNYDAIITSPPYLNRHDYTRIFALELTTGFIESHAEIRPIRYNSLRSHPEAKAPQEISLTGFTEPPKLVAVKRDLPENARSCDKRIHKMIGGYFEDMFLVLRAAKQQVRKHGHIAFVIGNVRFGGVFVPVDEIVGEIGEMVGLVCTDILVARERGNSAQQMRDYGKVNSQESIVIWKNP